MFANPFSKETFPQVCYWAGQQIIAKTPEDKERLNDGFIRLALQGATSEDAFTPWEPMVSRVIKDRVAKYARLFGGASA